MLVVILLLAVIFIVLATSKWKLHPFIALLIAAYGIAISVGMGYNEIASTMTKGFGGILAYIGIVIVLGTIIGVILEKSGAAITMANVILKIVGKKRPVLAMSVIGYIVSIPVFCDSGFVILNALKRSMVKQLKVSGVAMSVALATGLFATHTLVPPTPGPIAAAGNLMVDNLGLVIIFGIFISIITMLAGYFWALRSGKIYKSGEDTLVDLEKDSEVIEKYGELPSAFKSFAPIFIPILLMALASIIKLVFKDMSETSIYKLFIFLGNPTNALFIGLLFATMLLPKFDEERLSGWIGEGVKNAGEILIITGAGGALGAVLKASGIGAYLGDVLQTLSLGILVPFIIAAALKSAQGSSTTALVVTSTIIYPLLASLGLDSELGKVLTVMAIGAGAMTVSHANDSFFWVVSRFSQMDVATAYKAYTTATLLQGLVTIAIVYLLAGILL
ncbi:Gluconate transporter [Arcobacter nitrofigilis DSM 7299]|uniref:Gluconate transporter n=1 Tax=Arcobacter nitrofigilis (strain ATCC 33309 / DSM 7299 / CCUG 15893 / LMG 7604 / NCTC 12251 / CI) TaxID=572480 RepID=D5V186_ARCNC|nr:GntP family permease [Arcobacter nitrofigilis]ADG94048.1 Gluconate transporter [Arcobacter nitrofigilis DSM 7299]